MGWDRNWNSTWKLLSGISVPTISMNLMQKAGLMRLILTGLVSFILIVSNAQDLISTAGDFFQQEDGSISFTIGEPIIETIESVEHNITLTQGFQQSTPQVLTDVEPLDDIAVNIYPNPTTDYFNISMDEARFLDYQVFDLNGTLIKNDKITGLKTKVSLTGYLPSVYILKIIGNNTECKTFQIIKK